MVGMQNNAAIWEDTGSLWQAEHNLTFIPASALLGIYTHELKT